MFPAGGDLCFRPGILALGSEGQPYLHPACVAGLVSQEADRACGMVGSGEQRGRGLELARAALQ